MIKYSKHVPRSEEIVMAPATAQLVQLTISSELARRQKIPVPDMLPAAEIVVDAGRSFTMAAEEEAARLSPDCSRQVRSLTKDLDLAGSDLISVSHALRTDQSVALRTALRDSCFQYNLIVMKILLSLDGQKIKIIRNCGEQLIAEIHSIPQSSRNMKTLVPLFKHFIEDLTQFCYRISDYHKEIKDKATRLTIEQGLKLIKRTPSVISSILQDKARRSSIHTDVYLSENIKSFVGAVKVILNVLNDVDVDSATRYLELVLHASIAVAGERSQQRRQAVMRTCDEIIKIRSELAKLFSVTNQSSQSWNYINSLSTKMGEEFSELNKILSQTYKSADYYTDQSKPLLNLKSAAQSTYLPDDPELKQYIERFKQHANRLIDITEYAVEVSKEDDANIGVLKQIAADISVLGPKIIASALAVHAHPDENITLAFLNAMSSEWSKVVARLVSIIDNLTNTGDFMKASENNINHDMALSKQALINQDSAGLQRVAKAMLSRAQRVFHVGQKELLKSTSGTFTSHLESALLDLEHLLPKIITLTQSALENFDDINTQEDLATVAQDIARAVHQVKTIVCSYQGEEVITQVDAAKRLASALRGESGFFDIGVQTNPENIPNGENPDILLQFVMKDDSLDADDINNLVGVKGIRKPPASINDAIISLADLITTAMNGEPIESCLTILVAHCGRIKELTQKCHSLTDNEVRLRTIDFLFKEMNKLTPSVNDAARKTSANPQDAAALESLRWSARHWADSVIVLGKAFDDFGLGPTATQQSIKVPSLDGLISAASTGDREMTEAELDSLSLRTTKQTDLANYCSVACLSSTVAQQIETLSQDLENVFSEMSRAALALSECSDDITLSHLEHVCSEWQEIYQNLGNIVSENQPDTIPDETELGIPPSKVNVAIEQISSAAKSGNRPKVQVLGNSLSAMVTKMRRISRPFAESEDCAEYQKQYISEVNEELLQITPEVIKYGLLVAADPQNKDFDTLLDKFGNEWIDKMISLSNALEVIHTTPEDDTQENGPIVPIDEYNSKIPTVNHFPEDLHDPIKAAGYRLIRQETILQEGSELKEIKSVTTKLCDCLQVLSTTHHDVNERYEMEDTIEDVKSTVNQILLMRPGNLQTSVEEWLECTTRVKGHLDIFLKPLLEMVSCPKNIDMFKTSPERVSNLVEAVCNVTTNLKSALDFELITDEKEQNDVTIVMVTQSHVTKMTQPLCDAINVVKHKPNDTLQRTKFEAIKYQWATKFKLLTIIIDDIFGKYCTFLPKFNGGADTFVKTEDLEVLLSSINIISEDLQKEEFYDFVSVQISKLYDIIDSAESIRTMDYSQYLQLHIEATFAVYCIRCSVIKTCCKISDRVPLISLAMIDESALSFDPATLSDNADFTIDMIQLLTDYVAAKNSEETEKCEELKSISSSLIETLVLVSDHPDSDVLLDYQLKYLRWLCHTKELSGNDDLSNVKLGESDSFGEVKLSVEEGIVEPVNVSVDVDVDLELSDKEDHPEEDPLQSSLQVEPLERDEQRCSTFISEMSGSQTFSELHFSDDDEDEVRTPEPTLGAMLGEMREVTEENLTEETQDNLTEDDLTEEDTATTQEDTATTQEETATTQEETATTQEDTSEVEIADLESNGHTVSEDGTVSVEPEDVPDMLEALTLEYTSNPTQTAVVSDMKSVLSDSEETETSFLNSIKVLEEELAPWDVVRNMLLLATTQLLQQFVLIRRTIKTEDNNRANIDLIESATQITDITSDMCAHAASLISNCTHRGCVTDMVYCTEVLPPLAKQLMITCTLVSGDPHSSHTETVIGTHIKCMSDCTVKLLHSAYHAHLAGALEPTLEEMEWAGVEDSDDESVLV